MISKRKGISEIVFISLLLALALSPASAEKPNTAEGTFSAWVNANNWSAQNQTIFSAPSEGSAAESYGGGGGLI